MCQAALHAAVLVLFLPAATAQAADAAGASASGSAAVAASEPSFTHISVAGDTLIGLGRRYLADPAQWPQLQRLNQVANPRRIPVGTALQIPLRLMVTEPMPAQLLAATGDVRDAEGRLLVAGQALPQGSRLSTGDGQATVQLVDGTVLRLRPSSALQVDTSQRLPRAGVLRSGVQLQQGQLEVKARKVESVDTGAGTGASAGTGGAPGFRVETPQGVLGVRGTEFRVVVEPASAQTRGEVLEGRVAVNGLQGRSAQLVSAGQGVVVDRRGEVTPPSPLPAAPDLSGLPQHHDRPLLRFTLRAAPGVRAYRGQVATEEHFEQILADQRSPVTQGQAELRFADLPDGTYLLRLRAEDAQGLQGLDSRLAFTLKARPEPPLPRNPAPKAVMSGGRVEFAWTQTPQAGSYRIQIAQGEDFNQPLHDRRGLTEPTLQLDGLTPGVYLWRLASERSASDQGPFGSALRFELRALPAPLPVPRVGEDGIDLAWEGRPGQTFELQFARDSGFGSLVMSRETTTPALQASLPGPGRYFVRLRARDPDGFVGPFTAVQQFDLPSCLRDAQRRCVGTGDASWALTQP